MREGARGCQQVLHGHHSIGGELLEGGGKALRGGLGVHHHGELRLRVLQLTEGVERGTQLGKGFLHAHGDGLQAEKFRPDKRERIPRFSFEPSHLTGDCRAIRPYRKNCICLSHG